VLLIFFKIIFIVLVLFLTTYILIFVGNLIRFKSCHGGSEGRQCGQLITWENHVFGIVLGFRVKGHYSATPVVAREIATSIAFMKTIMILQKATSGRCYFNMHSGTLHPACSALLYARSMIR
jgi:hypothetical protein